MSDFTRVNIQVLGSEADVWTTCQQKVGKFVFNEQKIKKKCIEKLVLHVSFHGA